MRKSMTRLAGAAILALAAVCVTACQSNNGANPQGSAPNMSPTTNPSQANYVERHDTGNGAFGEDVP